MPTLIKNYQQKVNITKLKKTYSELSNAANYLLSNDFILCASGLSSDKRYCSAFDEPLTTEFKDEFVKLLDPVKVCGCEYGNRCNRPEDNWNGMTNGCYAGAGGTPYKDLNGNPVGSRNIDQRVLLLKDGTIVHFGKYDWPGLIVAVDVNGKKGPNVVSKDFFLFVLTPKGLLPYGSPNTDYFSHQYTGFLCEGDYSSSTLPTVIFYAAGVGCTAKYLRE